MITSEMNEILHDHNEREVSIISIFTDYVLEAEDVTSVDDESNKRKTASKLMETVKKLINEIMSIIEQCTLKISNTIKRIAQTDEGFKKKARDAIKDKKALEAIKLISYDFDVNFIEACMKNMTKTVFEFIESAKMTYKEQSDTNEVSPLDMKESDLIAEIFKKMGCGNDITDLNLYFKYMSDGYHKSKKEMLFTESNIHEYYNITMEYKQLKNIADSQQNAMKQHANGVKSNLNNIINNTATQDNVKRRAINQYKNTTHLFNLYSSFLRMYIQLRTERILIYRQIINRLYRI